LFRLEKPGFLHYTPERPIELSAVCFRYRVNQGGRDLNELNSVILRRVVENGRVYLSNASIRGNFALRACFVNHRTQDADVAQIVPEVLAAHDSSLREGEQWLKTKKKQLAPI
jgi:glutamate/tyrosine decarboxylase-like PLP-dependent enzyme